MPYPFASSDIYGSGRSGPAQFKSAPFSGSSRVLLVAINGDLLPPIFHDNTPLHRMRVTLVPSNEASEWESSDSLPPMLQRRLPPLPRALASPQPAPLQTRLVRGEILRDQEGRIYEKLGGGIRPLRKIFSGPRGEIVELLPVHEAVRGDLDSATEIPLDSEANADFVEMDSPEQPDSHRRPRHNKDLRQSQSVDQPKAANVGPPPCRTLFPEPGQKRVVRLGDFKTMLTPQLAHPERLREAHRLACYLQVYEAAKAQSLDSLAVSVLGNTAMVGQLQIVNEPVSRLLGLGGLLRNRPRIPPNFQRQPGMILPNERVFRLRLAHDPTANDERLAGESPNLPPKAPIAPMHRQSPSPSPAVSLKTSIPERFTKPWEFKLTREEVLYDMNVGSSFAGWFALLAGSVKRWIGVRRELKKWKVMLSGKTPDDQLWAIRPPRGGVFHRAIRGWAHKTLEAGGYEPHAMLLEWEIFWRRKGA